MPMKCNAGTVGDAHRWESMQPFHLVTAYATCVAQLAHVEDCPTCAHFTKNNLSGMVVYLKEAVAQAETELADRGFSWFSLFMLRRIMQQAGRYKGGQKKLPFPVQFQYVAAIDRDEVPPVFSQRFSSN